MRIESMRSHPTVVCHGGFKLGIVGSHVSQKLKVEALKIQSHDERHGQNVCEWTEFMWVSFNSRQRSYLVFQPSNSAQMSRIPISSSGIPRSCSMLQGNCHESWQRKTHAILRNMSKWESKVAEDIWYVFSLRAIPPSLPQFSMKKMVLRALELEKETCTELFWQKNLLWSNKHIINIIFPNGVSSFVPFVPSLRRRQAATFLHGAERVAQMTQKALQLALNVSNEVMGDATMGRITW